MERFALTTCTSHFTSRMKDVISAPKAHGGGRGRILFSCLLVGISAGLLPQAKAGFLDQYPLIDFTLTNTPNSVLTDGFVMMSGSSIVLTGGNSGSGEPGTTDLVTTATQSGLIQFDYSYSSLDSPTFDYAGYLLNGAFVQLADTDGESGLAQFNVNLGDTFGFRVGTVDNLFEPGILTVSSAMPEPGTGLMMLLVIAGILGYRLWSRLRTLGTEGDA